MRERFLREIGFPADWVNWFFSDITALNTLIKIHNGTIRGFNWMGITNITIEKREETPLES
jgi:hypothetical protein